MKEENKNRKGHEYGKHNFPSDINIHCARRLECNSAVIGLNREKMKEVEEECTHMSLIRHIRTSSIMDASNHQFRKFFSCCVKD